MYYKVVDNHLRSAITHTSEYEIQYVIGEKVYPVVGKIFIFDTYENAFNYCKDATRIFPCEAGGVERMPLMAMTAYDIEDFWKGNFNRAWNAPYGTLVADWVIPPW